MGNHLHTCLKLHRRVTLACYGESQELRFVERDVQQVLASGGSLHQVIATIYDSRHFDATMFGARPDIEAELKRQDWYAKWQELSDHKLFAKLHGVYRQIEPTSMVLRFTRPERCGLFSAPVASLLGIRQRRRQKGTYSAYVKSLQELRRLRGFDRVADVEMALWALQVGVLDGLLPGADRDALAKEHRRDTELRRMQAHNITAQLFSEWSKLELADALSKTCTDLAGQIAGIEFEQLVCEWASYDGSLERTIDASPASPSKKQDLHRAREIRNLAIHDPRKVKPEDIRELISEADWVKRRIPRTS